MTDNEILARWQGNPNFSQITLILQTDTGYWPDYPNDAAACDSLLDTLVEKGFEYRIYYTKENKHDVSVWPDSGNVIDTLGHVTRRAAVVAACLEVARKEQENGRN